MVKYCNAACKKKHRSKHKKKCNRRVAELHDEALFKQPPPKKDCPLCFLRIPSLESGSKYHLCCGQLVCSGCVHAVFTRAKGVSLCPFCRTPAFINDENITKRIEKQVQSKDPIAVYDLGCYYRDGFNGFPHDRKKALEHWHQAAELGNATGYNNIGWAYESGEGTEIDEKKANHYYELGAMTGNVNARYNLGINEGNAGNYDRALKHHMIAAAHGDTDSLKQVKQLFMDGYATKDDYTKALRSYQTYLGEVKSDQRDKAAAFDEMYRYY